MNSLPAPGWLPSPLEVNSNWDVFVQACFEVFQRDFVNAKPRCFGRPLFHDTRIDREDPPPGRPLGFWHLTTTCENRYDAQGRRMVAIGRLPELQRSARINWVLPTIEHARDSANLVWDYQEASGKIRTYIWNDSQDWLVIVEKQNRPKGTIYMLITSFLVKYDSKRDDLVRKYRQRIEWK